MVMSSLGSLGSLTRIVSLVSTVAVSGCGDSKNTSSVSDSSSCKVDSDCSGEALCVSGVCENAEVPELESLVVRSGVTDSAGAVLLDSLPVSVKSSGVGVESASVWSISNGRRTEVITVGSREYMPSRVMVETSSGTEVVSSGLGTWSQSLSSSVDVVLDRISEGGKLYDILSDAPRGSLLSDERYVTRVCMTRDQIETSVFEVPSSILEWVGIGSKVSAIAGHFGSFKSLFFDILIPELKDYGNARGYVVAIPKVQDVFLGDDFIFDSSTHLLYGVPLEELGDQMRKMPYWRVEGVCDPSESRACTYTPGKVCLGDIIFLQDACGTQTEVSRCGEEEFCYSGKCRSVDDEGVPECARSDEAPRDLYCVQGRIFGIDACGLQTVVDDCYSRRDTDNRTYLCSEGRCVKRGSDSSCTLVEVVCSGDFVVSRDSCGNSRVDETCSDPLYCNSGRCVARVGVEVQDGIDNNGDGRIDEGFVNSGDVQVTLSWDSAADLDVLVYSPDGCQISWELPVCGGGQLDLDSRRECRGDRRIENVFYSAPPVGQYTVMVNSYDACSGPLSVPYRVSVSVRGVVQMYEGLVGLDGRVEVTRFRY